MDSIAWLRFPDREIFRWMVTEVESLEIPQHEIATKEPSLPHSTWLYWSEFGSTMGALSCPERGKIGGVGVGPGK